MSYKAIAIYLPFIKMKLKTLQYCFILALLILSCNNNEKTIVDNKRFEDKTELSISTADINAIQYNEFVLSNEAADLVIKWTGFQEIASQVEFLKTADFTFFKGESSDIKNVFDTAIKNIPEELDINPIKSRFTVIETKFLKLQNDLTLDNISKQDQMETIKGVLVAWSNMILGINKKLEFENNDVNRPE